MARKQSAQRKTHTPDPGNTRRWRSVRRQIDALDVATFNAIAGTKSPLLDATMPRLTRAADRSVLWIAIAGLMVLSGRARARLGAARGLVSIAITSLIANQVSKRIHRRPRPSITQVPAQRLAHRIPESTSFPSGHSASAMAFAAGASAEWPALSVPLRTLAGPAVHEAFPRMRIVELGRDGEDYGQVIRETAASCEVLAVAGGDGTVQQAAAEAMHHGIPLAVFPAGTFNHFAKDLGMFPLKAAIDAIHAGTYAKVDLGEANGTIFVNTASIGAYTDFVAIREKYERRISKPLAAVIAAIRTLGRGKAVRVRVQDLDGETVDAKFSLLFIGNGRYEPRGFAPVYRAALDDSRLDLRVLGVTRLASRGRVLLDLLTGRVARNKRYQQFADAEYHLELPEGPYRIARDGEVGEEIDHLDARVLPRALTVITPARRKKR